MKCTPVETLDSTINTYLSIRVFASRHEVANAAPSTVGAYHRASKNQSPVGVVSHISTSLSRQLAASSSAPEMTFGEV